MERASAPVHQMVLRHNTCIAQLTDENLCHSFNVLQGVVAALRTHVAQAMTIQTSSSAKSPVWALTPRRESISHDDSVDSIYDHPILIQWNEALFPEDEPSLSLFSATILFNMALVCHRMGLVYHSEPSLIRASKLYLVVDELLRVRAATTESQPTILLLSLAVHNMGHLQNGMNNYPAYQRCMVALWNLMPRIHEKNDPDLEHHLRRSLRLWQCTAPPMAAAA
jgi:hypothetical protein